MVSLLRLSEINEEGVSFSSPVDGTRLMLTPEKSIETQVLLDTQLIVFIFSTLSFYLFI